MFFQRNQYFFRTDYTTNMTLKRSLNITYENCVSIQKKTEMLLNKCYYVGSRRIKTQLGTYYTVK